jgi:hypothetical protein
MVLGATLIHFAARCPSPWSVEEQGVSSNANGQKALGDAERAIVAGLSFK